MAKRRSMESTPLVGIHRSGHSFSGEFRYGPIPADLTRIVFIVGNDSGFRRFGCVSVCDPAGRQVDFLWGQLSGRMWTLSRQP